MGVKASGNKTSLGGSAGVAWAGDVGGFGGLGAAQRVFLLRVGGDAQPLEARTL